jgi:hypothetical protein
MMNHERRFAAARFDPQKCFAAVQRVKLDNEKKKQEAVLIIACVGGPESRSGRVCKNYPSFLPFPNG